MTIAYLHLSDIHIETETDVILARTNEIVAAIQNRLTDVTTLVLLTTGDITQSGKPDQFKLALSFFNALTTKIAQASAVKIELAFTPGNHDLDFATAKAARDILLKSPRSIEPEIIKEIVSPLEAFTVFRKQLSQTTYDAPLAWAHSHENSKASTVCLNTAWCSQIKESQGSLRFPLSQLPTPQKNVPLVAYAFHHPFNWLEETNYHELSEALSARCDLIFTGHEHDPDAYEKVSADRKARGLFIEGAVLQDRGNNSNSGFHLINVDLEQRRHLIHSFTWTESLYTPTTTPNWQPFHGTRPAELDDYRLTNEHRDYIDDIGATIRHPNKGALRLSDIFVYPDLRKTDRGGADKIVAGENLLEFVLTDRRILIYGAERSGKTTLAKKLFAGLLQRGILPVLVDGAELRLWGDSRDNEFFSELFSRQYTHPSREHFAQTSKSKRAAVIDNIDASKSSRGTLRQTLANISAQFEIIIILASDGFQGIQEVTESSAATAQFAALRLLPLGHLRRGQLIERWLKHDADEHEHDLEHQIATMKRTLDIALGQGFVPALPIFILSILQGTTQNQNFDTRISTYAHFYEILINTSVALQGSQIEKKDVMMEYLSAIASEMLRRKSRLFSDEELRQLHADFEKSTEVPLDYVSILGTLIRTQILSKSAAGYKFRYQYQFYYFAARHINNQLTEERTVETAKLTISELCDDLSNEESANTILFLAHFSKHSHLIRQLITHADAKFADLKHAELRYSGEDSTAVHKVVYEDLPSKTIRESELVRRDNAEHERERRGEMDARLREVNEHYRRFYEADKTMQILGQLLRNFPASISGIDKRTLIRATYGVGLRSLSWLLGVLDETKDDLIESIVLAIREDEPHLSKEDVERLAKSALNELRLLLCYSMTRKTSQAIGAPHLATLVSKIAEEDGTDPLKLLALFVQIDSAGTQFPDGDTIDTYEDFESNILVRQMIRRIVVGRLYLFNIDYKTKQRLCESLDIELKRTLDPRRRALASSNS